MKSIMTDSGLAIVMESPCCGSNMNLSPRKPVLDMKTGIVNTDFDPICVKCGQAFSVNIDIQPIIRNISFFVGVTP